MKISEMIAEMQQLMDAHGDLTCAVTKGSFDGPDQLLDAGVSVEHISNFDNIGLRMDSLPQSVLVFAPGGGEWL